MFLDRYFAGSVSVAANGTTVTGTGTAWAANGVQPGDYLHARGLMVRIAAVVSNTSITLAEGWPGTTLSGAGYAILYRVDADRYGAGQAQLLNTLASGNLSSLAALPGNANRLAYFSAQNTMAEAVITTFGRSLLEDANAAAFWATVGATSDPAQAFRRGNILGAVSQSGGVPTGALVEYGSNANGEYWRFAGGLQLCGFTVSVGDVTNASGSLFMSASQVWTFPMPFASSTNMAPNGVSSSSGIRFLVGDSGTATSWTFRVASPVSSTVATSVRLSAQGRWA